MTPGARVAAAIEILGDMSGGLATEQALTRWARRSRFAGSKDRAAIRDHVFDVLRSKPLAAHLGNGHDPRELMIGLMRLQSVDLASIFSGEGHAPSPLDENEQQAPAAATDIPTTWCLPEWLLPLFKDAFGEGAQDAALALQDRAPIALRVNTAKKDVSSVQNALQAQGVETTQNKLCATALTVTSGARQIRNSTVYQDGLVELQDAASQAVAAAVPPGGRVLDYCAGGGGKALALAANGSQQVFAHDSDPRRMSDLPRRAARAGVDITQIATADLQAQAPFDTILCDAPCSGSGAWRRSPEGKWTLTPARLDELTGIQDGILDAASLLVAPNGTLAYATCSIFAEENEARADAFLARHKRWSQVYQCRYAIDEDGDGFFTTHLRRV